MDLPKQDNYDVAFALALNALKKSNISQRCERAGVCYDPEAKVISVDYLNRCCLIEMPEGHFRWQLDSEEVPLRDRILMLHYLDRASGRNLSDRLISFAEVPAGQHYLPAFRKRSVDIVLRAFGDRPETLVDAASQLGGRKAEYGDVSATIYVLPRVPITLVLWRGDDELQSSANILFDATVSEYLPTEDIAVLAGVVAVKLYKTLDTPKGT